MLPLGPRLSSTSPATLNPALGSFSSPLCLPKAGSPCLAAGPRPSPPVPGTIKAQSTGQLKAECLLQVGTAVMVDNLPEMQAAVIQQGQEAALGGVQRPRLGGRTGRGSQGSQASQRGQRLTWPGKKCIWVTVAISRCRPVNSTPGAP